MNENKTIVTTLDFKMVGEKELVGLFQNLNQLFDTEKLKTEANKVHATLLGVFNNIEKDLMSGTAVDVNKTGVMKGLNQLSALLDKIQVKAVGSSATKVLAELDGKIAAAQARVDKAMESVKKIDKEIEAKKAELSKRMQDGSFGQVFTEDLQETDNVISKLAEVRKEMEELDAAGKDITGLKKQEESLIRLAQAIQDVNKDLIKLGRSKGGHASQKTQGENALKDLTSQKKDTIAANPKEVSDQAKAYQRLYDVLELFRTLNLDQSVRDEREEREKSNEETKKATEENEKLNRSVKKGEKTWGRKVVEMFAYQNVLRQVKQIWTTSIQVITELDRAMVEAAIVTNMTTKETWKLLGSYQELADVVGRSTSEIASLNAFFLQQGLTVKNAMEMTEVAAKSAAIAGISLQESANYLTSAINGFGLAASAAEEVADKFAAVGAATAADFEELAIAMSKVAPVAQSAGVGIDFMMGVLAKGIHTTREAPENIGTAFKTIFARMSELTDMGKAMEDGMSLNRVEKALESVGISLRDQMGQFRDLEDVLYEVGFAWKDLDSLQQNYLATALAGTRQQPRLMAILNDFEETVDFINISKDSAQAMEFQHMEYMTGMEAASQSVKNAWEKVVTSFVDSEVVISALKAISSIVNGLAKIIDFLNNGVVRFILVTGLAGVAVILLKKGLATLGRQIKLAAIDTTLMTAAEVNAALATMTLTGAMKTLAASINTALGPIGWIVMALTAVVVIGKALYDTFKDTTMSVEEANKAIYESEQRNKGLDSTISRFEELQKKINKTNEELEEMIELQNQLEAFDGADGEQINFISEDQYGNRTVDQEKVRNNRLEEETIQANARRDIERNIKNENYELLQYNNMLKNIKSNIESIENMQTNDEFMYYAADLEGYKHSLAYYEELVSEEMKKMEEKFGKEFKKIGRKAGEDFGKGLLKDGRITQGQVDEYEKAVGRVMGSVNFSNFLTDDGKADTKLAIKMGAQIGDIVGKAFESANNSEKMNLGLEEGLSAQLKAYQDMIKELDTLGLSPSEMNEIKVQLGFEFGNEQALEVLKDKNIDMSVVATFIDKGGKLEQLHSVLKSLGQMENEDVNNETWQEQEVRRKQAEDKIKKLDDSDAEQDQRIVDEEWKGRWITQKQVRAQRDIVKGDNAIEREKLQKELDEMLTQEQKALSKVSDESVAKLFSREDLEGSIEELRATLVEGGMDLISAGQYIESEITSQLGLKNAAQIADAGANIGNTMSKALKIGEQIAAGDFTGYLELAQEFSQEAVDTFLETGNISGLVDKATENMIQDINVQREKLKGDLLSEEEILAEIERMRVDGKSQPEIDNYLKSTENINKNTNEQIKSLNIMEGSMDAINFKMSVYESFTKSAADNFAKANGFLSDMEALLEAGFGEDNAMVGLLKGLEEQYRDQALEDSFNNLANIQSELERDKKELIEKEFMDVDGNMIPKEAGKELQEAYKNLLESAADAAKNVTGEVLRRIEINNKEYAEKIKESNETYKNLIDSMNKMHKTRWDDVSYENKLIDLQKNIYDARNKLSSAQIGGTQKQMQDAQEELRRMQQERRKAIEDESIRRLEEDLEKQRKKAEDDLEAEKLEENKKLVKNIGDLNKTMIESNELAKIEVKEDKKIADKPTITRPSSGGGGKGHQISLEKTIT